MSSTGNPIMILGVAGGVAVGLLVANWSPVRAVIYAVIWLVAAGVLMVRGQLRRKAPEEPAND
ncbi:hypothetical protein [Nocardia sp. AG03]|uniref:hypothetical protein n=1 Tax=Nocardia sp. AG03 TaxID=3025312 RepID=UPI0024185452|nr:hypothetical protein [Nocardia sp. AG03]